MYNFNHPHEKCILDISRLIAKRITNHARDIQFPLDDGSARGGVLPCYPGIAERFGTSGDYYFKVPKVPKVLNLREYVVGSFNEYRKHGRDDMSVPHSHRVRYEVIANLLHGREE